VSGRSRQEKRPAGKGRPLLRTLRRPSRQTRSDAQSIARLDRLFNIFRTKAIDGVGA
jgi:hypothetical protein